MILGNVFCFKSVFFKIKIKRYLINFKKSFIVFFLKNISYDFLENAYRKNILLKTFRIKILLNIL